MDGYRLTERGFRHLQILFLRLRLKALKQINLLSGWQSRKYRSIPDLQTLDKGFLCIEVAQFRRATVFKAGVYILPDS